MTREEAYNRIDAIIAKHEIDEEYVTITNFKDYDALRIAREILEQEPYEELDFIQPKKTVGKLISIDVLDKIRAEIERIADEEQKHDEKWTIGLRYAVKIIDKYKAETE